MTDSEAREIYRMFFRCFPYAKQFLDKCDDPEGTYAEWRSMLVSVDYDPALEALHRMREGKLAVPDKPWEMGMLPLKIRAYAGRIMDDNRKAAAREKVHSEAVKRKNNTDTHLYNPGGIGKLVLLSGSWCRNGRISQDEHDRNVRKLRELVHMQRGPDDHGYRTLTLADVFEMTNVKPIEVSA